MQNFETERPTDKTNALNDTRSHISQNAWKDIETSSYKSESKIPKEFGSLSFTNGDLTAKIPGGPVDGDDMSPDKDLRSRTQLAASDPENLVDFAKGNDEGKLYN